MIKHKEKIEVNYEDYTYSFYYRRNIHLPVFGKRSSIEVNYSDFLKLLTVNYCYHFINNNQEYLDILDANNIITFRALHDELDHYLIVQRKRIAAAPAAVSPATRYSADSDSDDGLGEFSKVVNRPNKFGKRKKNKSKRLNRAKSRKTCMKRNSMYHCNKK
jgi:hypothetical protein